MPCDPRTYLGPSWNGQPISLLDDPWFRFSRLLDELDANRAVQPGARWLDLGCHQGEWLTLLQAKYGVQATGIDVWPAALKGDASWAYEQHTIAGAFELGRRFDWVSALETIEHIIDTDGFLESCREHLVAGGRLLLTTPNINSLRNRIAVPMGAYPAALEYRTVIHHVRLYNAPALRSHVTEHGLHVHWVRGVRLCPASALRHGFPRAASDALANAAPQLCGNLMLLASRV